MYSQLDNTYIKPQPDGIFVLNKTHSQHNIPSSPKLFVSGNFENDNYRLSFTNPYQPSDEYSEILSPLMHSCFLGFIQSNDSKDVGPFILNMTPSEENRSLQILDLNIKFLDEEYFLGNNQIQSKIIKSVENKLKTELSNDNSKVENKKLSENFAKNQKENLLFENIQFKITPLPFDNYFVNSTYRNIEVGVDQECQTSTICNTEPQLDTDLINVLKDQIQVLKEQNILLRKNQENKQRRANSKQKEYVIRKTTNSSMKNTRENSIVSTDTLIHSISSKSEIIKDNQRDISNLTLITKENSSLQEMLQEYMLENEALREMNITLEERRNSHTSEMHSISRRNRELSLQVEELNKKIEENNKIRNSEIALSETRKESSQNQNIVYPITYEKLEQKNDKTSYLQQFDMNKNRQHNETFKQTNIPVMKKSSESNVKSDEDVRKASNRNVNNETLLEELSRIDETIKDHIRKNRFNETLRNMGKKQSPRKN